MALESENRTTYLFLHGAWHGAWAFDEVVSIMSARGMQATALDLPGHGKDPAEPSRVTMDDYADRLVEVLDAINGDVILVAHSLGGGAASLAAERRAQKVKAVGYVAAFLPQSGDTLLGLASADEKAEVYPSLTFNEAQTLSFFDRDSARRVFYGDVEDSHLVEAAIEQLGPQPLAPYVHEFSLTPGGYGSVRKFYVKTLRDRAITPEFQQFMIERLDGNIPVRELDTGHSPFLSQPNEFVAVLESMADGLAD